jgi:hypothetical protein
VTRSVMRFANWLITPDRAEGAPHPLFEMECTTCPTGPESRSEASEDFADAQDWALRHSGRNPGHTHYREIVTRFWRTQMVDPGPG